jgi:hypothetical protein
VATSAGAPRSLRAARARDGDSASRSVTVLDLLVSVDGQFGDFRAGILEALLELDDPGATLLDLIFAIGSRPSPMDLWQRVKGTSATGGR